MKRWISFVLCICMLMGVAMLSGCGGTAPTAAFTEARKAS